MNRKTNLLALLGAGLLTVLAVASFSNAASTAAPTLQSAPTISGTPAVGSTLTATSGSWSSSSTIHYTYQWRRCSSAGTGCSNIGGADSSTDQVRGADVGHTLPGRGTGRDGGGPAPAGSHPTGRGKPPGPPPP